MSKIKVLPQEIVNKIAAGEVVERPASVVKELLENSIDAGALNIKIDIEEGGVKKIAITDDGCGLSLDDLKMCILPHATSKLTTEEDLMSIKSYGFRGEALASIVAISKTTITTRTKDQSIGHELKIEGGYMVSLSEMGCPVGTTIVVEDLFYNVPARREFVRGDTSEYKAIVDIVNDIAIAYPSTGINFNHNSKNVYTLPKNHQLEDRVKQLFGSDFFDKLIPVFYEHPHIEIYGFITKPEIASTKRKEQLVFVNKRSVTDKSIAFAVKEAFGGLIPPGAYPGYILFIDVPANIVDVNVHPRKEEVRFSNTQLIFTSIKQAVKKALELNTLTPGANKNPMGAMPGMGMPGMPAGLGGMPPGMGAMPGMGLPGIPAGLGGMPPGMGAIPGMPTGLGGMPSAMGGMPAGLGGLPQGLAGLQALQGLAGLGGMPGATPRPMIPYPGMGLPMGIPAMPGMSGLPAGMASMPGYGGVPGGIRPGFNPFMPNTLGQTQSPKDNIADANIEEPKKNDSEDKFGGSVNLTNKDKNQHTFKDQDSKQTKNNLNTQNQNPVSTGINSSDNSNQSNNQVSGTNTNPNLGPSQQMPFGMPPGMGYPMMRPVMPYPGMSMPMGIPVMPGLGSLPAGLSGLPQGFGALPQGMGGMPGMQMPQVGQPGQSQSTMPFWNDPFKDVKNMGTKNNKLFIVHKLYIIKETADGIIIYDQHAVHERILYEKLVKEHKDKKSVGDTQSLLAPVIINLSISEDSIIQEYITDIEDLGFSIEEFGPHTYKITKVPNILAKANIKELIHEFLEDLDHDNAIKTVDTKSNKALTYLACRSAYKAGDSITDQEALEMINKLDSGENTYTCPHGRPVKIELTLNELAKMFKRTGFE